MADTHTRGGTHDQHVKAGEQSHKTTSSSHDTQGKHDAASSQKGHATTSGTQGGTHEQHVKAGQQSHKNG